MALCSFVERRHNRYYFRARLPVDIALAVGRTHVVASLGTTDPRVAKYAVAKIVMWFTHIVATLRLEMRRRSDSIEPCRDPAQALAMAAFDLGRRYAAEDAALREKFRSELGDLVASVRAMTAQGMDGLTAWPGQQDRTDIEIWRPIETLGFGDIIDGKARPDRPLIHPPLTSASADGRSFRPWHSFRAEFLRDKPDLSSKTLWSYNQAFDIWMTLIGDKAIGAIRRPDLELFADHLRDRDNPRGGSLNYKTILRSLGHLKTFMAWAVAAGLAEDDRFGDVAARSRTAAEKLEGDPRRAFTAEELDWLFRTPMFSTPRDHDDLAARWFLAIAALTGARTEEIATAPATLVRVGDVDCIDLRVAGRKTGAAPRLIGSA